MRFAFDFNENHGFSKKEEPVSAFFASIPSWVGTAASIGGALIGAAGASQQHESEAQAADYNAAMARHEAEAEESRRRRESSRQLAQIRSGRAKSGVTTEGTPLMVLAESAELAEVDALSARWSGETSAKLDEQRARSARRAKPYAVGSALLGGMASLGSRIT